MGTNHLRNHCDHTVYVYVALNTAMFDVRAFTPENGNVEIATAHYVNRHLYLPPFCGR